MTTTKTNMIDFEETPQQKAVANRIREQLNTKVNGFPLLALIGAKRESFGALPGDGGLSFAIGKPTSGLKANVVMVKYDAGNDLYNVEFWYIGYGKDVSITERESGLDVEQMISYVARKLIAGCNL